MFGNKSVRTGIDLGTGSVKLVRGVGNGRLDKITHVGYSSWDGDGFTDSAKRAEDALRRLMDRLGLSSRKLGKVAVAVSTQDASVREVMMPPMDDGELAKAVVFESRKHLDLEDMVAPVLGSQLLGRVDGADGAEQMRVLLAAVPKPVRDFPLQVLDSAGIAADVVDLESLASLNAMFAVNPDLDREQALGLIDLGNWHVEMHLACRAGGLVSRRVGPGVPEKDDPDALLDYFEDLAAQINETLTFYRGRYRREVAEVYLSGGGALVPSLTAELGKAAGRPLKILDPFGDLADKAEGFKSADEFRPRFTTACGLCRWWDDGDV